MKIEIEYKITKRKIVECDDITEAKKALVNTDWKTGGSVICNTPEIISRVVIDDEVATWNPRREILEVKPEFSKNEIVTPKAWLEEVKRRIEIVRKNNEGWTQEKCRFLVLNDMPPCPRAR